MLNPTDLPAANSIHFYFINSNLSAVFAFRLIKDTVIIAPELIKGLCGRPLGFKVKALYETPLGSFPTC
jgi:hypothetical protein